MSKTEKKENVIIEGNFYFHKTMEIKKAFRAEKKKRYSIENSIIVESSSGAPGIEFNTGHKGLKGIFDRNSVLFCSGVKRLWNISSFNIQSFYEMEGDFVDESLESFVQGCIQTHLSKVNTFALEEITKRKDSIIGLLKASMEDVNELKNILGNEYIQTTFITSLAAELSEAIKKTIVGENNKSIFSFLSRK